MARPKIHGHRGTRKSRTYKTFDCMCQRVLNRNAPNFNNYGGAGIKICDRWNPRVTAMPQAFINFLSDMGVRPANRSLDRINPFGNYEPRNCRWATCRMQNGNKKRNLKQHWR